MWASTNNQVANSEPGANPELFSYGIALTDDLRVTYSAQYAIHLVSLLLAVVFDRQNVDAIHSTPSSDLISGLILEADAPNNQQITYLSPKAIQAEYIKLKWSLADMIRFNLRVRRWLSERNSTTSDGIGHTIYMLLIDLDKRMKSA